jgi:hypothetical protein
MHVVGHDDVGVKLVAVFVSIFPKDTEQKVGIRFDLEEPSPVCSSSGGKERESIHYCVEV